MKKPKTSLMLLLATFITMSSYSLPILNSLPSAKPTVYLDFSGYYVNSPVWNNGVPFACAAPTFTDAQITEIFNRVSEDYRPFSLNITTDSMVYLSAPMAQRTRVVITPTSSWYPGVGGISYVGSFTWGDNTPCFVFSALLGNDPKVVAECCSHEAGHTLGLSHQSSWDSACNLVSVYNSGAGNGETGWAPIMGDSYSRNMTGWNNGPTPYGCSILQDNLSIITSQNGFSYRKDDYTSTLDSTATQLNPSSISVNGIIEQTNDQDAFRFTLPQNTSFYLNATPYNVGPNDDGADLDIKLQLFDANANLLQTYAGVTVLSATIDTVLSAGTYYVRIDGTGNANATNYGSIGSYSMRGVSTVLPIHSIDLSGNVDNDKQNLKWSIISDDPITTIFVESSTDGSNFNSISTVSPTSNNFSYSPFESGNIYYRLKVTSNAGQTMYSNVIVLKNTGKVAKSFSVSTLVLNDISVNASTNYMYQLMDLNGRMLAKGIGVGGFNTISLANQPKGMYILELISNNEKQVERIIRQ